MVVISIKTFPFVYLSSSLFIAWISSFSILFRSCEFVNFPYKCKNVILTAYRRLLWRVFSQLGMQSYNTLSNCLAYYWCILYIPDMNYDILQFLSIAVYYRTLTIVFHLIRKQLIISQI